MSKIAKVFRFLTGVYRRRRLFSQLLESGNLHFVRFAPPGHFYSPLPDAREITANADAIFDRSAATIPAVAIDAQAQIGLLREFAPFYAQMPFGDRRSEGFRYHLDNPFYSYGDGIVLYSILRRFRPARVVEIGSGYSSAEMLDLNERFFGHDIAFTFVEPDPARLFRLLSERDRGAVRIETRPVQGVELGIYDDLAANDILFVDSSHVAKTGSDVLHLLFAVLPRLQAGVLVHFHDVLWPFEYPRNWLGEGRAWNEAYMLRAFLAYNTAFEILYFNSYMALRQTALVGECMPRALTAPSSAMTPGNSSLWLRKLA